MKVEETNLGFVIETPNYTALFGGQKATFTNLQASFTDFTMIRIKQTHGDISVFSENPELDYKVEADAHFTNHKNIGLCISTADCVPVLIYDPKTHYIAAIHAGWRGVANRIVPKTLTTLKKLGCDTNTLQVLIGPHIQMNSFEVQNSVRDEILSSVQAKANQQESLYHRTLSPEKSLVDLNQVMKTQLQEAGIAFDHLYNLHLDTVTDLRFHSHRRDKDKAGRQLSFICQT